MAAPGECRHFELRANAVVCPIRHIDAQRNMNLASLGGPLAAIAAALTGTSAGAAGSYAGLLEHPALCLLQCMETAPFLAAQSFDAWRLVRTPNAGGGAAAVSIMHTADVARSDLDLAGLMLRCGENGVEALVVIIDPRRPRAQPRIKLGTGGDSATFTASMVPPFSLILLPSDAAALLTGRWKSRPELAIEINGDGAPVHGVVPLAGLAEALQSLDDGCMSR